jgi:hypothetical protein
MSEVGMPALRQSSDDEDITIDREFHPNWELEQA